MCETKLGVMPDGALEKVTITDFVDELVAALVTLRLYDRKHARSRGRLVELKRLHEQLAKATPEGSLVLATTEGYVLYEDRPLLGASMGAKKLVDPLVARNSGGLEFRRELGESDLEVLLELLGGPVEDKTHELANMRLRMNGCQGIGFLPPYQTGMHSSRGQARQSSGADGGLGEPGVLLPMQRRQRIVDSLQGASISVARGGIVDLQDIQSVAQLLCDSVRRDPGEVQNMVRYERYDAYTFGHSVRVCALALSFASHLTDDVSLLIRIGSAGLLHDIGKMRIASEVLHHRGRLSPEQRAEMERHTDFGSAVLLAQKGVDEIAVTVSHGHHRNLDGTGYPADPLDIPQSMVTRLIKICDVYEALTAVRPYKGAMSPTKAFRLMLDSPGAFDPALLRKFIRTMGCYPVGSAVELSDRSYARVLQSTDDLVRPVVQLERADSGEELDPRDRRTVDLSAPENRDLDVHRLLEIGRLQIELAAIGDPAPDSNQELAPAA
jgi:HD-GYP domain-containing protein (c-di-GMP phosphodiesterase class II)